MKILAIECSAITASVSVYEDAKQLSYGFINAGLTHSQTLMPLVKNALELSNTAVKDIDYFAVSSGPGSFTGLRIGISAVKGMAATLDKQCIGVSTLEAMAYNYINVKDCIICAVMDARCKQVYNALFKCSGGCVQRLTEDRAITIEQLKEELKKEYRENDIIVTGDGTDITLAALAETELNIMPVNPQLKYQNSNGTALCALKKAENGEAAISANRLMPVYLRLPQAERELKKKQAKN